MLTLVWEAESLVCILYSPKVPGIGDSYLFKNNTHLRLWLVSLIFPPHVWLSWSAHLKKTNEGLSKLWGWGWGLASESSCHVDANLHPRHLMCFLYHRACCERACGRRHWSALCVSYGCNYMQAICISLREESSFPLKIDLFWWGWVFCLHIYPSLHHVHTQCPWRPVERTDPFDFSYRQCDLPCGCWELNLGALEDGPALFTAEPSLQPPLFRSWN